MGRPNDSAARRDACTPQHSLFYALGPTEEGLNQLLIGVVSAYSEIIPGYLHLDKITEAVRARIRMAGGTPIVVPSIDVCDGIAMEHISMKYFLASRELIADGVETTARAHGFDGLVLVPNCDKIVSGMLIEALRVNALSVVMSSGAMLSGDDGGKAMSLSTMFEVVGVKGAGLIDQAELTHIGQNTRPGCDSCPGMFTASSMNCLCEVLGIALPGSGTIPAMYSVRTRLVKRAGMAVADMVGKDVRLRDVVSEKSLRNGLACDMVLDCSSNTVLYLLATARETKVELDLDMVSEVSQKTPNLCKLAPAGPDHVVDLHNAGGVQTVMKELSGKQLIDTGLMTVTGRTVVENTMTAMNMDTNIIKGIEHLNSAIGGVVVLFGNTAPKGCVVKRSVVGPKVMTHTGLACVFDNEEAAIEIIYAGSIVKGDAVVTRYEGPEGGPSMREMLNPTSALAGMQLDKDAALITDRCSSGATRGAVIGRAFPEAAAQGPIATIQEGGSTVIDTPNGNISPGADTAEVKQRLRV